MKQTLTIAALVLTLGLPVHAGILDAIPGRTVVPSGMADAGVIVGVMSAPERVEDSEVPGWVRLEAALEGQIYTVLCAPGAAPKNSASRACAQALLGDQLKITRLRVPRAALGCGEGASPAVWGAVAPAGGYEITRTGYHRTGGATDKCRVTLPDGTVQTVDCTDLGSDGWWEERTVPAPVPQLPPAPGPGGTDLWIPVPEPEPAPRVLPASSSAPHPVIFALEATVASRGGS